MWKHRAQQRRATEISTFRITVVEPGHVKSAAWRSRLWKGYMREAGIGFLMLNFLGRSIFFSIDFDIYSNTQCSK
jgi:hypothetical protein